MFKGTYTNPRLLVTACPILKKGINWTAVEAICFVFLRRGDEICDMKNEITLFLCERTIKHHPIVNASLAVIGRWGKRSDVGIAQEKRICSQLALNSTMLHSCPQISVLTVFLYLYLHFF